MYYVFKGLIKLKNWESFSAFREITKENHNGPLVQRYGLFKGPGGGVDISLDNDAHMFAVPPKKK